MAVAGGYVCYHGPQHSLPSLFPMLAIFPLSVVRLRFRLPPLSPQQDRARPPPKMQQRWAHDATNDSSGTTIHACNKRRSIPQANQPRPLLLPTINTPPQNPYCRPFSASHHTAQTDCYFGNRGREYPVSTHPAEPSRRSKLWRPSNISQWK